MYVLMFTRLIGNNDFVALTGAYESEEEAKAALLEEYDRVIDEMGFDENLCKVEDDGLQAFCGSFDMTDVIRLLVFDTDHPYGFDNNRVLDFHVVANENGFDV